MYTPDLHVFHVVLVDSFHISYQGLPYSLPTLMVIEYRVLHVFILYWFNPFFFKLGDDWP